MTKKSAELSQWLQESTERKAELISMLWWQWNNDRSEWLEEKQELRNYLFATDTTTTTNNSLPWKNSTTVPKLTQIRDNLHANYLSTAMPNDNWLVWEGYELKDEVSEKRKAIQGYMENKLRESNARTTVSELLLDYIDYGNAFASVKFIEEKKEDPDTGEIIPGYIGPVLERISPLDIAFDLTAAKWKDTPNIVRHVYTLGGLEEMAQSYPEYTKMHEAVQKAKDLRKLTAYYSVDDFRKASAIAVDGFGSYFNYLQTGNVEVLEFEGDLYDESSSKLLKNRRIIVIDRMYVLAEQSIPSWFDGTTRFHVGWRSRPDNLYGMGPLDNLVGMQYRIDHLENLKADVFDLIAFPPLVIKGEVDEFDWGPLERIYISDENGSVEMLPPDTTALNADTQIEILKRDMEEYAGAPKQSMGIRTPGEKTAFEVRALENNASRIFQEKIVNFEVNLLEPAINMMLESAKRNMVASDVIRVMDSDLGVAEFLTVTKEDITAKGNIRPIGARHFAQNAQIIQNLTQLFNSNMGQAVAPHMSTKNLALALEGLIGLERYHLFSPNIGVVEHAETQQIANQAAEETQVMNNTPVHGQPNNGQSGQ